MRPSSPSNYTFTGAQVVTIHGSSSPPLSPSNHSVSEDDFDGSNLSDSDLLEAIVRAENLDCDAPVTKDYDKGSHPHINDRGTSPQRTVLSQARFSPLGQDDFGVPNFTDPEVVTALKDSERHVLPSGKAEADVIQISRAELEAIKRNAFAAGQANYHTKWRRSNIFPFLDLPAEIRLAIYEYALVDTSSNRIGENIQALPKRYHDGSLHGILSGAHCCSSVWHGTQRPIMNMALLQTCKQVYLEARDDVLYKDRRFHAEVHDLALGLTEYGPNLRFWKHIRHLHLTITGSVEFVRKRQVRAGIEYIVALLYGGSNLRSFKLDYKIRGHSNAVSFFEDLRVKGPVSITQAFNDWDDEAGRRWEAQRIERLETLMFKMLNLPETAPIDHDIIVSQSRDENNIRSEMYIAISSNGT